MPKNTQTVPFSPTDSDEIQQSVNYDTAEDWIIINHGGTELSMHVDNWIKLVDLAAKTLMS